MGSTTFRSSPSRPLTPAKLQAHSAHHQFTEDDLDWQTPVDRTANFLCPTLTPLYYVDSYQRLNDPQKLRYNQLMGLCSNELLSVLERSLQPIFRGLAKNHQLPQDVRALLPGFIADEQRHADIWWKLNRLVEPNWYATDSPKLVHLPPIARGMIGGFSKLSAWFPVCVWTILALEEHAIEIAVRGQKSAVPIEPRFVAAYRLHAQDEARHVQIDWQVLEILLVCLPSWMLRLNIRLFRAVIDRFLFRPLNIAASVVRQLAVEYPELLEMQPIMMRQLHELHQSLEYRQMIFSRRSNPVTFGLIDRLDAAQKAFADLG